MRKTTSNQKSVLLSYYIKVNLRPDSYPCLKEEESYQTL
jgi:hypothetical protein